MAKRCVAPAVTAVKVHLLSALDTGTGIVLAQVTIDAKSNRSLPSPHCSTLSNASWAACRGAVRLHTQTGHADEVARPRNSPARAGQSQPADSVQTAQTASLGVDPGR
ncbi:hypothetical protein [Actinoplanes philippinensis]|uniref:hypothetical protein n=1 Tax=Actinoplanes philippinensis TaxID=35752 RepID=UPI0033E975C0